MIEVVGEPAQGGQAGNANREHRLKPACGRQACATGI